MIRLRVLVWRYYMKRVGEGFARPAEDAHVQLFQKLRAVVDREN
jgi:hypothetical protein